MSKLHNQFKSKIAAAITRDLRERYLIDARFTVREANNPDAPEPKRHVAIATKPTVSRSPVKVTRTVVMLDDGSSCTLTRCPPKVAKGAYRRPSAGVVSGTGGRGIWDHVTTGRRGEANCSSSKN